MERSIWAERSWFLLSVVRGEEDEVITYFRNTYQSSQQTLPSMCPSAQQLAIISSRDTCRLQIQFHFTETTEEQAQHIGVEYRRYRRNSVADNKEQTEELRTNLRHQKKKTLNTAPPQHTMDKS